MPPFADVLQWEHLPFPKSLRDFQRLFATDEACARYLEGAGPTYDGIYQGTWKHPTMDSHHD